MTFNLSSLLDKSSRLQQQIDAEQKRARPDWLRLMRLKKLRLQLMDRLHGLARMQHGRNHPPLSALGA